MSILKLGEKARNILVLTYTEDIVVEDETQTPYGRMLQFLDSLQIPCACSCVHEVYAL